MHIVNLRRASLVVRHDALHLLSVALEPTLVLLKRQNCERLLDLNGDVCEHRRRVAVTTSREAPTGSTHSNSSVPVRTFNGEKDETDEEHGEHNDRLWLVLPPRADTKLGKGVGQRKREERQPYP
eukprot:scaffold126974_cov32-Tisochrysis_lutea.AAC.2